MASLRDKSLSYNTINLLKVLEDKGSKDAFLRNLSSSLCASMPHLSLDRKLGSSHARSLPPTSYFEKMPSPLAGSVVAGTKKCLQERELSLKVKKILREREPKHLPFRDKKVVKSSRVNREGKGSFVPFFIVFGGWSRRG